MGDGGFGRIFVWAAIGLVCLVLLPFILFSSLLGASSAATCGTAVASTPGDLSSLGDLSQDDPVDMPPLEIARRIYAVAVAMKMSDDRRLLTAYAVALVESGGGVTMVNVRGSPGDPGSTSTGVFQQRDIAPWNRRNRNNVSAASISFFEALRGFDHGQSVGELAADIQRPDSRYRYRYALAVPRARYFLAKVKGGPLPPDQGLGSITAAGTSCGGAVGPPGRAKIGHDNDLIPPANAPPRIVKVIEAANRINDTPYVWGGGHAGYGLDDGYDCSGSVSYALHGGGFMPGPPITAIDFKHIGDPGKGHWISIYSNFEHVFMYVAGVRFDTSPWGDRAGDGPRWRSTPRSLAGFTVTHPRGY